MDTNIQSAAWIIAELGAVNWGLVELIDTNLVTEALGSGSSGIAYIVIGLAGALALAEKAGAIDLEEIGG